MKNISLRLRSLAGVAILQGLVLASQPAMACEPAAIDWAHVAKQTGIAAGKPLKLSHFARITDFAPYGWPSDFTGKDKHKELFDALDSNSDGKLVPAELLDIYRYFPNPCADWPWR